MLFLGCLLLGALRLQFYFNEIKSIFCLLQVKFQHVGCTASRFANRLAKQGVDRSSDLHAFTM